MRFFPSALLALLGLACSCSAASAPEWVRPFLAGEAATWQPKHPVVTLFHRQEVRFSAPDRATTVIRSAVRAGTEEGVRQLATQLSYNSDYMKLVVVRAWIISPKGKVTSISRDQFVDRPLSSDSRFWNHARILIYDGSGEAEIGSVLASEYTYDHPALNGQCGWSPSPFFALFRGEFEVVPPANARLDWHSPSPGIPAPQSGAAPGSLVWHLDKIKLVPGALPEGFRPERLAIQVKCSRQDAPSLTATEGWSALATLQNQFYAEKAVVTDEIQAIANAEVTGKKDRWERIRALTQYVQKKVSFFAVTEDTDVFSGYRPHTPAQVIERKMGDCKDKVTLLLALLRAAGEEGLPVLVRVGNPGGVDPSWPAEDFNHAIVALRSDDDVPAWWPKVKGPSGSVYVLFDPTARTIPLGCLPLSDQGGYVLLAAPQQGGLIPVTGDFSEVPPLSLKMEMTLEQDGSAKISEVDEARGTEAAIMQSTMDSVNKSQATKWLERSIAEYVPTARQLTWSMDWDATIAHLVIQTHFVVAEAGRKIGADKMLFTPPFQKARMSLSPWETTHRGVAYLTRVAIDEEIRVVLAEGITVEELPQSLRVEQGGATAEISYTKNDSGVVCTQRYVRPAGAYSKSDYDKVRLLGEKLSNAQRRPLILKTSRAPASEAK